MVTVYLSKWIDSATGVNLDKTVEPLGITRKEAVRSTGYARFEGTPGTTVPGSTIIKTVDDVPVEFKTDTSLVLAANEITNGEFTSDAVGWTAVNGATLTSVAGGKDGNCLQIACDGSNNPYAKQIIAVTAGHFYEMSVFMHEGTAATYNVDVYDETNSAYIYESDDLTDTAADWSNGLLPYFEVPATCSSISVHLVHRATAGAATTMLFDTCELVRVVPITAVDAGVDGDVAIGVILALDSPISGITSVNNPAITSDGLEKETDVALRIRTKQSIGAGGKATLNAIVAAVLAVDGVSSVIIEENDSAVDYIDMLLNSGFPVDTASWVANNDAVLASVAGGSPDNCLEITGGGAGAAADPFASQTITVVTDDTYTLYVDVKKGTEEDYNVDVWDNDNGASIDASGDKVAAVGWGTLIETSFIIPTGCTSVDVRLKQRALANTADTIYFDTVLFSGLPPHSVRVSVRGGEDNDIAQAILDSVAGGIQAYGTDYGTGELDNGQTFDRYFARPLTRLIAVAATITSDDTYAGDDAVETAIIGYIGGDDVDGTTSAGLGAGGDVLFYEVISAIMNVTGVTNVALTVDGGTSDISIATIEVAYTTVSDVVIS